MKNMMMRFIKDEQGQDLIEYSLLIAFVALASAGLYASLSGNISSIWGTANTTITSVSAS